MQLMHSMARHGPTTLHGIQARTAWAQGDVQHAFWHFLAASETGAEANLMNAAWILNRGYRSLPLICATVVGDCIYLAMRHSAWFPSHPSTLPVVLQRYQGVNPA